jgi:polysaccharide chain length determinant protein (PEP-CTERM system associated)
MWHRRWFGLAVAWVAAIVGAIVVFRLPDKYEASARVYVDTQSLLRPLLRGMAITPDASQQVAILSRTLLTRPNVEKIIRKADLDTAARAKAEELVDTTLSDLRISRAGGDNVYTIAFRYPDGRKARDVVQAALSIFIEQSLGDTRVDADAARKFLDQQIKEYEQKLQESEMRTQAFRLKYMGLLGTSGNSYLSQMGAVSEQMKEARVELRVAEQTREGIRRQLEEQTQPTERDEPKPRAIRIAVPELDTRIEAQKRQLDELLRKYTEQHPDVVGTKRLLAQLEGERDAEMEIRRKATADQPNAPFSGDPIAQQLKVALNEAEARMNTLRARLAEHEARYNHLRASAESLPRIETELGQLNRDYEFQKRQYDNFVARRETANLSSTLDDAGVAEFRIIEPPRVSPKPVAPNRLVLLAALLGGSLAAGLAVSFAVSQTHPTFHEGRALREVAGRPLLGMVSTVLNPEIRRRRRQASLMFAGGIGGLLVCYGAALAFTFLTAHAN